MNTIGDPLGQLRKFSCMDCTGEAAGEMLGQGVHEGIGSMPAPRWSGTSSPELDLQIRVLP